MTYLTERIFQKPILRSRFFKLALISLVLIVLQATPASAQQWNTNGTNISNANAGNVGIGNTAPLATLSVGNRGNVSVTNNAADLIVAGSTTLGTTLDAMAYVGELRALNFANNARLLFSQHRVTSGSDWTTGSWRIQPAVDNSFTGVNSNRGYIELDYGNQRVGISGAGNTAPDLIVSSSGNVGIGTTAPASLLNIAETSVANTRGILNDQYSADTTAGLIHFRKSRNATVGSQTIVQSGDNIGNLMFSGSDGAGFLQAAYVRGAVDGTPGTNDMPGRLEFATTLDGASAATERMRITNDGNVGIGITTPSTKLHVAGSITVDGNINAKFQDVAEWVPASEQIPAGTVVVLDSTKSNHVISSTRGYDTRVAGVVSAQPGIVLGERGDSKVLVATTGRVRVRVDARRAAIQVGDLLVTSDVPGLAMKSEPVNVGGVELHRPGTLIGKALEPLMKGEGEILVLLSLQ